MKSTTSLLSLTICLCLLVGYNFMSAAWTAAPANPPANNVEAPINVSDTTQTKAGRLNIQSGSSMTTAVSAVMFRTNGTAWANMQVASVEMRSPRYCNESGTDCFDPEAVYTPVAITCPSGQAIRAISVSGVPTCATLTTGTTGGRMVTGCGSCPSGCTLMSIGGRCTSSSDTFNCWCN
jgi:hypothetical protein